MIYKYASCIEYWVLEQSQIKALHYLIIGQAEGVIERPQNRCWYMTSALDTRIAIIVEDVPSVVEPLQKSSSSQ